MRMFLAPLMLWVCTSDAFAETLPQHAQNFFANHCLDCHDRDTYEGEVNLEFQNLDWTDPRQIETWERVLSAVELGEMPPADYEAPDKKERDKFLQWADQTLLAKIPVGGTPARRLNQDEYQASLESLLGLRDFALPPGFPQDREFHGYDNLGQGLVLSPPLLESYAETARLAADRIFPPSRNSVASQSRQASAKDLVISYSSGKVVDDALRLGMKCDPIQRSCTWPSRIEISVSGVYRLTLQLSAFRGDLHEGPMVAKVFARDVASSDGVTHTKLRLLKEIEVNQESPEAFTFDAELYRGQTPVIHWANARLDSDRADRDALVDFFRQRQAENKDYLAAWHAMTEGSGQGFRGGIGWQRVKKQMQSKLEPLSEERQSAFLKKVAGNPVLYAETVVFDVFENGPALEIHQLSVEGPLQLVDGPEEQQAKQRQKRFLAAGNDANEVIGKFLASAFRRPVDNETVSLYQSLYDRHLKEGHSEEEAMHLVIRQALISPRFLYRCLQEGELDAHDLATRLSFFLTGRPPDPKLLAKARDGSLTEPKTLRSQAERLVPKAAGATMVRRFTGQWLDTDNLDDIMPDPKFKFSAADQSMARQEVENFFAEMIRENRPMTDFIAPDFTWTSARMAKNVYGLNSGYNKKNKKIQRISLNRQQWPGGVLGMSAVMMATANGVDTQPVVRGVWVLENVLGIHPPPPPNAVPPITPDTTGASTPRELLAAHTSEESCSHCHRKIDPLGLALENLDPVGRWRDQWPGIPGTIDASGRMPDGSEINDVIDLKNWLVVNIDQFSACLSQQLMTYATGRQPNYAEKREIEGIVRQNRESGGGFRDLMMDLVDSRTFRTK